MTALDDILNEGKTIQQIARPAERQRQWRIWNDHVKSFFEANPDMRVTLQFRVDSLSKDLQRLADLQKRSESQSEVPGNNDVANVGKDAPTDVSAEKPFTVFVSHRTKQDQEIATMIRDKLRILSHGKIECFVSDKIRGGEDWYQWVETHVSKADLFLLIYSDEEMDLRWCLYETGLFRGYQPNSSHLVCLKNSNIQFPLSPIERFQAYQADEDGLRRFLTELLYHGDFTKKTPINSSLLSDDMTEFARAVKDVQSLFQERQVHRVYFRRRLEIHVDDPEDGQGPADAESNAELMMKSPIEAGELSRDLLGLPQGDLLWRNVYDQLQDQGHGWVKQVHDSAQAIFDNRPIKQVLKSFSAPSGQECVPLLARIEHVKRRPKLFSIIFIDVDKLERSEASEDLMRSPVAMRTIVSLLNMARRFRWNIIEHSISKLGKPIISDAEVRDHLSELSEQLIVLEQDAEKAGYLHQDAIVMAMPEVPRNVIAQFFDDYRDDRIELNSAIEAVDSESVIECLKRMRTMNKRFLLLGLQEYIRLVSMIEPQDMTV